MWTAANRENYSRKTTRYQSDVTDEEWRIIGPLLPRPRTTGRPRVWPLREIVNGIFYVIRSGCTWRARLAVRSSPIRGRSGTSSRDRMIRRLAARRSPILARRLLRVRPGASVDRITRLQHGGHQPCDVGQAQVEQDKGLQARPVLEPLRAVDHDPVLAGHRRSALFRRARTS